MPTADFANLAMATQQLFTIEQFELVRRLRNSGMTKEQVSQAYEALDRLDRELGTIFTIPMTLPPAFTIPTIRQLIPNAAQNLSAANNLAAASNLAAVNNLAAAQAAANSFAAAGIAMNLTPRHPLPQTTSPTNTTNTVASTQATNFVKNDSAGLTRKRSIDALNPTSNGDSSQSTEAFEDDPEKNQEFKDFVSQGEFNCCEEIRNFVQQHNIKQQQVAALSGVSQSYVSRYLKGDLHDMSERSKRSIQKWYIIFKNNPKAVAPAANEAMLTKSPVSIKKFITMDPMSQEMVNQPKRERFVFRPSHLEVLERHFNEDSYPTQEKREDIARQCNAIYESQGRSLVEKERVSSQVVANWFANKRKELKKIAREEGLDISQILRSRGRPMRYLPDLNQADMTGQSIISDPSSSNGVMSEQLSGMDLSSGANMDTSSFLEESVEDTSLSMAVEMAAVNQAIIALSGQQPISLGLESKEDKPAATPVTSSSNAASSTSAAEEVACATSIDTCQSQASS